MNEKKLDKKNTAENASVNLKRRFFYRDLISSAGASAADILRGGSAQKPTSNLVEKIAPVETSNELSEPTVSRSRSRHIISDNNNT